MSRRHPAGAMPEAHDAIRIQVGEDEPPAVVFHERAPPGALVSWAWCQLTTLDALLQAMTDRRRGGRDEADIAGAVRSVLVPAINALALSERRAHELQCERETPPPGQRKKKHPARTAKTAAD